MSLKYIRNYYEVPARVGGRVEYTGGREPVLGTIEEADGAYLLIRMDGSAVSRRFHPTWKLRYLDQGFDAELREVGL